MMLPYMSTSSVSMRSTNSRSGFTLIELLIAIGIIGILAAVVIVAVNPEKQFCDTQNVTRSVHIRVIEKAMMQYMIEESSVPGGDEVPVGEENAIPICRAGVTDASCVNLDVLVPDYIVAIPVDETESSLIHGGFSVYLDSGSRPQSIALNMEECIVTVAVSSESSSEEGGEEDSGQGTGVACHPSGLGSAPTTPTLVGTKLYIASMMGNSVAVLDSVTDTVLSTISLSAGARKPTLVGTKLYVPTGNDLTVVNSITDTIITTINIGAQTYTPTLVDTKLYVPTTSNIVIVDTTSDTVMTTSGMGNFSTSPVVVGTNLYAVDSGGNSLTVIDTATDTITTTLGIGYQPFSSPAVVGTKLYIANYGANTVSVINTLTNTVIATINVGTGPMSTPAVVGTKVYIANSGGSSVSVIDSTTDTVIETIAPYPTNAFANPIAIIAVGSKVYVGNAGNSTVNVIDSATDTVTTSIAGFATASNADAGFTRVGTKLYGTDGSDTLSIIYTTNDTLFLCGGGE